MPQVFAPQANTLARAVLLAGALLFSGGAALLIVLPFTAHVTEQDVVVEQPIQFSHSHHSGGLGIECRYCHTSVEQSRYAGLPPTHTCMSCHSQIWTNAAILAPCAKAYSARTQSAGSG